MADVLANVESFRTAPDMVRDAFHYQMRRHSYGYEETLDAWHWFLFGWNAASRHQKSPQLSLVG